MAVSNFPIPPNSAHPSEPAGAQFLKQQELPVEYPGIIFKQMIDGGGTYGADTTNSVRRFTLTYDGLTAAQAAVFDAHYAEALGTLLGFNFRYYRTGASVNHDELISDCHYESFTSDHNLYDKTQSRTITIVKRPN